MAPRRKKVRHNVPTRTPEKKPLPNAALDVLPTEILRQILFLLPKTDLRSIRLVRSDLARLSLESLYWDVKNVYMRSHFDRLKSIARRPYVSRWMKSSHCQAGIYHMSSHHALRDGTDNFKACRALCEDRSRVRREGYDFECLSQLVKGCPKLQEVTIAFGAGTRGGRESASDFLPSSYCWSRDPSPVSVREPCKC